MLSQHDKDFLRLLMRSPDRGEGWRSVSERCWPLVEAFGTPELLEIDTPNRRCRLTPDGEAVATFSL